MKELITVWICFTIIKPSSLQDLTSDWTTWSNPPCPESCGYPNTKNIFRQRTCQEQSSVCRDPLFETSTVFCAPTDCPVDGGWSEWQEWQVDVCRATCGEIANIFSFRKRLCASPMPIGNGSKCVGDPLQTKLEECRNTKCPDEVSQWGTWDNPQCIAECGEEGSVNSTRSRSCTVPGNGIACSVPMSETEVRNCTPSGCPVNGNFTSWSLWNTGQCLETCGLSAVKYSFRTRTCSNPYPEFGGEKCTGAIFETMIDQCDVINCPIDGGVSQWGEFDAVTCTETCGVDVMSATTRQRNCTEPTPQHGGADCSLPLEEVVPRPCLIPLCLDDDVLSKWSTWQDNPCPGTCGQLGQRILTRVRTCITPKSGNTCASPLTDVESRLCDLEPCPVDGGMTNWSLWTTEQCAATCGISLLRFEYRTRSCTNPITKNGGKFCTESPYESKLANCDIQSCSLNAVWGSWTNWEDSTCSLTCDKGTLTSTRARNCNKAIIIGNALDCVGNSTEAIVKECELSQCQTQVDATLWTEWTNPTCRVSCGTAQKIISRQLVCPDTTPDHIKCIGSLIQTRAMTCGLSDCPIDGGHSVWSEWSSNCSTTCGTGIRTVQKTRQCGSPTPRNGGKDCPGPLSETLMETCYIVCPEEPSSNVNSVILGIVIAVGGFLAIIIIAIIIVIICKQRSHRKSKLDNITFDPEPRDSRPFIFQTVDAQNPILVPSTSYYEDAGWNSSYGKLPEETANGLVKFSEYEQEKALHF